MGDELVYDKDKGPLKITGLKKTYRITIKAKYEVKVKVHADPDDADLGDNAVTLESTDGAYSQTVPWTEGEESGGAVTVTFKDVLADKDYNLKVDPGAAGEPYYVARNVHASKQKLKQHMLG